MTIESALTDLMIDTITLAAVSTTDAYGKHSWSSPVSVAHCRVQTGAHKITDSNGQEVVASGVVYVPGAPAVTPESKIVLPDTTSPRILKIDRYSDERGNHHIAIHYGESVR